MDHWADIAADYRSQIAVREPATYGPGSPNSYFRDLAISAAPYGFAEERPAAEARLRRHAQDVAREARSGDQRALRALRNIARRSDRQQSEREFRAMTTDGSSGGSLTTPAFLAEQYAPFRSYVPSFADDCGKGELPEYGMTVNVAAVVTSADDASEQGAENSLTGTTFATEYETVDVSTYAGLTEVCVLVSGMVLAQRLYR